MRHNATNNITLVECPTINLWFTFRLMKRYLFNPIALRKAKIACNFGLSECSRVTGWFLGFQVYHIFASSKLLESTCYKEINKFH